MTSQPHHLETGFAVSLKYLLLVGAPFSLVALVYRAPGPHDALLTYNLVHLFLLQLAALALAHTLAPLCDQPWFQNTRKPWLASAATLVALVTGFAALLTLATSAASRFDPSLQFLQLLSSLDIAWATAALYLGARALWGNKAGLALSLGLVVACVGSIAAYLTSVGFTPVGGWLVDGGELMRLVIPSDMVAAVAAVGVLLLAGRRQSEPTEQRSPQS